MDRGEGDGTMARERGWRRMTGFVRPQPWFHPSYLVDWLVTVVLLLISQKVETIQPFQRAIPSTDPGITFPFTHHERVPDDLLDRLTFYLPSVLVVVWAIAKRDGQDVHHAILGVWTSRNVMRITIEMLKNRIGRFRPDFLSRCHYDLIKGQCTGEPWLIADGRKSFPSGHSASSFVGLGFLALYIAGKTRAFTLGTESSLDQTEEPGSIGQKTTHSMVRIFRFLTLSILFRLILSLSPLVLATWIAITRLEDYRHHPTDVLAGSAIGFIGALVIYHVYYPNVFNPAIGDLSKPKDVYGPFSWSTSPDENRDEDDERSPLLGREGEGVV